MRLFHEIFRKKDESTISAISTLCENSNKVEEENS